MKIKLVNENFTTDYTRNLLASRGIDKENFEKFMNPGPEALQDPSTFANIHSGAAMYIRTVIQGGRILIVVDSDCDGFTSAAIIYQYTKQLNCHCPIDYWLHEGKQHGLQDHIDRLIEQNSTYDLIILPDSSSNDAKYHDMLEEIHIPCLILDHHLTDTKLSDNAIVINNQMSPKYLNKELVGTGVAYQFCRYVDRIVNQNWADEYVDLAALGQIGDMGSVLEIENRYIIKKGFANIKNKFFKALLEKQAYSITRIVGATFQDVLEKLTPTAVAFYIVPLINGMIRVGSMEEKERLFLAFIDGDRLVPCGKRGAKGTMEKVAIESARECTNAKARQDKSKLAAVERLEAKIFKHDLLENQVLFVRLDETDKFPAELNGLIAMQLCARYKKPTIVARLNDEGYVRGSARGLNESALTSFKKYLDSTGMFEYTAGHDNAFGISIPNARLAEFHALANEQLTQYDFNQNCYDVNFMRHSDANDLSDLVLDLGKYTDIWGQCNKEALIYIKDAVVDTRNMRVMGSSQDTAKFTINGIDYIKFKAKDLIEELQQINGRVKMDLVCKANINEWGGRFTPQLLVEDCDFVTLETTF